MAPYRGDAFGGPNPPLKSRLKNGETVKGCFLMFVKGGDVVQFLGNAGMDFCFLDVEHGSYDLQETRNLVLAARSVGLSLIIRGNKADRDIGRYLDMGASGFVLPLVESAEQAEDLVYYGRYSPLGGRGMCFMNGHNNFAPNPDPEAFTKRMNDEVMLFPMIETVKGLENLEEIVSIPGIDGIFVGTGDLSMSMGFGGAADHPDVWKECERVFEATKKRGLFFSLFIYTPAHVEAWVKKGLRMVVFGTEGSLLETGFREFEKALNSSMQDLQ